MNKTAKTMLLSNTGRKNRESERDNRYNVRMNSRERGYNSSYEKDYPHGDIGRSGRQGREYDDYGGYDQGMDRENYDGYSRRKGREGQSREMRIEGRAGRSDDGDYYASGYLMPEDDEPEKLTHETAKKWLDHMENEDGTKGPHWTFDQAKQLMEQKKLDCDPVEFWVALNMMFSDYSAVAKKSNVSTVDFYTDMAKAFLCDKDAKPDKLEWYYQSVVKHE